MTIANMDLHNKLTEGAAIHVSYFDDQDGFLLAQSIKSAAFDEVDESF